MNKNKSGIIFGILAFTIWGLFPLYFKSINHFSSLEITAYRIIWSFLTLFFFLVFKIKILEVARAILFEGHIYKLLVSTVLIAVNWFLFVYAIEQNQILQTSFGYFISPLLSILLGIFILKEKVTKLKVFASILLLISIGVQSFSYDQLPWISLVIAISFSLYGLTKKYIPIGSVDSVTFETFALFFPSFILLFKLESSGGGHYLVASGMDNLLIFCSGLITIMPMILFSAAAKRIPISSLGFIQFIAPSLQFIIGAFYYNEIMDSTKWISFILIWIACLIVAIAGIKDQLTTTKGLV
jgi:chloramphenicol-sensitive protein RarD